ncbi:MAG: hypothetical protein D6681_05135, partial [Calditrichaeota bacterium]
TLSLSKGDNYLAVFVILRQAQYDKTILSIATTLKRETTRGLIFGKIIPRCENGRNGYTGENRWIQP